MLAGVACVQMGAQTESAPSDTTNPAAPPVSSAEASKQARKASDAADQVQRLSAKAADDTDKALKYQKAINAISGPAARSSQLPSDDVGNLLAVLQSIQTNDLLNSLNGDSSSLAETSTAVAALSQACDPKNLQQPSTGPQQDVTNAAEKCALVQKDAADKLSSLSAAQGGLTSALSTVPTYMAKQFDDLLDKLAIFSDRSLIGANGATLPSAPDASLLLQVLPKGLPALRDVVDNAQQIGSAWKSMQPVLSSLPDSAKKADAKDPGAELKNLQATIDGIKLKLASWLSTVAQRVTADAKSLEGQTSDVLLDPAKNSAAALGEVREKTSTLSAAQAVVDAVPPLIGFLEDGKPQGFALKTVTDNQDDLQKRTNVLRASISRVHDALAGDFAGFETDQVSLYYFTDVARLMYALNEGYLTVGGVADAEAKAAAQRTALTQAELDLADAQATVNRYQKQVSDLQEQQRQAQFKLKGLNSSVSKLANRLKTAQDAKDRTDTNYKLAQDKQNSAPDDPTQKVAVDKAAGEQTKAATKVSQAQSDYDAAKSDQQKAQSQMDETQNQKDSLPAKLAAAQQALSDAQTAVAAERRKMILAAQAESDAFAFARDNTPFMYAMADASSPNPAKRVMLYAFNDNKTIFMRGKRPDLDEVKKIIAAFDQPAPQARLTLWTFELSAEAGQKANKGSAEKLNRAMAIIDEELSGTRALQNTTLTLLRELINKAVRERTVDPNSLPTCELCTPEDTLKRARLAFYDPFVLKQMHVDPTKPLTETDQPMLDRMRGEIPDPAGTTTLGEALMVLSLARPDTRMVIRDTFETQILERLGALSIAPKIKDQIRLSDLRSCPYHNVLSECFFPLTWHGLGIWEGDLSPGLTSQQLEITRALNDAYTKAVLKSWTLKAQGWLDELPALTSEMNSIQNDMATLENKATQTRKLSDHLSPSEKTKEILERLAPPDRSSYTQKHDKFVTLQARQQTIDKQSFPMIDELRRRGFDVGDLVSKIGAAQALGRPSTDSLQALRGIIASITVTATPREAAADEMLKAMIIALEDDLDRVFMQPIVKGLRERLISEGINVGVLQRESMLATNRGKARVDPRASAQLAVGEQEDILAGVQQLAQLYGAVQSGGALAALGALEGLPREQQPEIYALTTGNKFEVTPIFDPSGQALRFKFDFVGITKLQEPNGTINPQLPRIERHTVNTEVQLSNLETREISRYESDARLGLPTQYWGGIPILKDIPYVRPWIPLVGWFVRKAGSNAVAQQSVIFGQTTIYPSIQNMVSLLEDTQSTMNEGK